jgi:hypothetical protein
MAVAANNGHARLCQAQLRPDHVHNPLLRRIHIKEPDTKFPAILLQGFNLSRGNGVGDRGTARLGWNVVVYRGYGSQRLPDPAPGRSQAIESLGRGNLMDEVQVNVKNRRPTAGFGYQVGGPDLFE